MGRWWFLLQSGGYLVPQRQLHTQSKLGCPQMPELPPWNPAASQRLL